MRLGSRLPSLGGGTDFSAVNEDIIFVGARSIKSGVGADIRLLPGVGGIVKIGDAGTSSHGVNANDDLFVSGKLEVNGTTYLDGILHLGVELRCNDNIGYTLGNSRDSVLVFSTLQITANTTIFGVDSNSRIFLLTDKANYLKDHDHAAQPNPTIFCHSATDPDTNNTQWISFSHDQTNGVIESGLGGIELKPANNYVDIQTKLRFSGDATISTQSSGKIILLPAPSGITVIGNAGSTSHGLAANNDLFVSGKIEVDGWSYFDGPVIIYDRLQLDNDKYLSFGGPNDSTMRMSTAQTTADGLLLGLHSTSFIFIVCNDTNVSQDFDHALPTNPTIFCHSRVDPDSDNTQWISLSHNELDGVIMVGKGTLNLGSANGKVNFSTASVTGSTVTHDAYVELEVGGVTKKFMLGA